MTPGRYEGGDYLIHGEDDDRSFVTEREALLRRRIGLRHVYKRSRLRLMALSAQAELEGHVDGAFVNDPLQLELTRMEAHEEQAIAMAQAAMAEATDAVKSLKLTINELADISMVVQHKLMDHIHEIRGARMTITRELGDAMNSLRDVRTFFLHADYQVEVQRLRQFVDLCKELRELADSGLLDAVSSSILNLAEGPKK